MTRALATAADAAAGVIRRLVLSARVLLLRANQKNAQTPAPSGDCAIEVHVFGPWSACACDQAIPDHTSWFGIDGWCGWEHRRCQHCSHSQECRAADLATDPLTIEGAERQV
jgi:hypothetical protein